MDRARDAQDAFGAWFTHEAVKSLDHRFTALGTGCPEATLLVRPQPWGVVDVRPNARETTLDEPVRHRPRPTLAIHDAKLDEAPVRRPNTYVRIHKDWNELDIESMGRMRQPVILCGNVSGSRGVRS